MGAEDWIQLSLLANQSIAQTDNVKTKRYLSQTN